MFNKSRFSDFLYSFFCTLEIRKIWSGGVMHAPTLTIFKSEASQATYNSWCSKEIKLLEFQISVPLECLFSKLCFYDEQRYNSNQYMYTVLNSCTFRRN